VSGAAGASDDAGKSVRARLFRKVYEKVGGTMRGNHLCVVLDAEFLQAIYRVLHNGPVTGTAHNYRHYWMRHGLLRVIPKKRAIITRNG